MDLSDARDAFIGKLGAEEDRGRDHIYFYYQDGASQYTVGKLSHSWRGALNSTQVGMLARKLHLQMREFRDFVSCNLDKDGALRIWRSRRPS